MGRISAALVVRRFVTCDAKSDEDTNAAMQANEQARQNDSDDDDSDDEYVRSRTPDWDESIYGDARPGCSCGYADGLYTYCAC